MIELQHLNVKLFVEGNPELDLEPVIPVFHRWIQEQIFSPQLLIDVADYRHVFQGPGVVLIGFESDFGIDQTEGRLGLKVNQKAPIAGTNLERLRAVFASALRAARHLEAEKGLQGKLKFDRKTWEIFVNDRALAPNTRETFAEAKVDLEDFFREILNGNTVALSQHSDPRARFGVTVAAAEPVEWVKVLKKLQEG